VPFHPPPPHLPAPPTDVSSPFFTRLGPHQAGVPRTANGQDNLTIDEPFRRARRFHPEPCNRVSTASSGLGQAQSAARVARTKPSVSSRTTRARAVAVIPRISAAPTPAAAAAVTPCAAATVPRAERRTRGAMSVGNDPAREPRQRAPAKPGEKRRTSVGLLGSKRRHVRLSGTGIRPRIKKMAPPDTRAKNHCRTCSAPIQFPTNPIWHRMEIRFFSAGYEHHQPPTTTAHALQRPRVPSTYPRSTYEAHFVARPRRVTACSETSGHQIAENAVYFFGRMQDVVLITLVQLPVY